MNIPQLAQDKANHALYGAAAALLGAALVTVIASAFVHWVALLPWHGALAGAAVVGGWKELRDKVLGTGEPSWQDFAATVAGGLAIALATLVSQLGHMT